MHRPGNTKSCIPFHDLHESLPQAAMFTQDCPDTSSYCCCTQQADARPARVLVLTVPPKKISPHILQGPLGHSIRMSLPQRLALGIPSVMVPTQAPDCTPLRVLTAHPYLTSVICVNVCCLPVSLVKR